MIERRADRALLIRIAVAGAVAGNIMLLAFALYGGAFHGIEAEFERLFRWLSMALALPSVLWCAAVFYRGAWGSLRTADRPHGCAYLDRASWPASAGARSTPSAARARSTSTRSRC